NRTATLAGATGGPVKTGLVKRVLVGPPKPSDEARHERLIKTVALAVFSSDALSSVAYATEEILLVLVLAGAAAADLAIPVALALPAPSPPGGGGSPRTPPPPPLP